MIFEWLRGIRIQILYLMHDFKIKEFCDILKSNNINVTIRKEMGGNLSAACGQLRANNMK